MSFDEMPPEGRLTDEARARIRAGVVTATEQPQRRTRPWLVPVAAAAAVGLLLAGVATVGVALMSGDHQSQGAPAADDSPSSDPTSLEPTPTESTSPSPSPTATAQGADPSACDSEVSDAADIGSVPSGLERIAHVSFDGSTTWLYSNGQLALVCDDWPAQFGGTATLTAPRPVTPTLGESELSISQNFSPSGEAQYFAAGPRIPGVTSIQYSFPDADGWADGGHVVHAVLTDDMWVMQFVRPHMPPGLPAGPVKIAVGVEDGSLQFFQLSELDLCAQINHGC
jgi:hypothetical protein